MDDSIPVINISAKNQTGINEFEESIKDMFFSGELEFNDEVYITNALCNLHKVYIARKLTYLSFFKQIDEILKTANNLYK